MDGRDWVNLLSEHPEFTDKCDWKELRSDDWKELLKARPEFAEKHKKYKAKAEKREAQEAESLWVTKSPVILCGERDGVKLNAELRFTKGFGKASSSCSKNGEDVSSCKEENAFWNGVAKVCKTVAESKNITASDVKASAVAKIAIEVPPDSAADAEAVVKELAAESLTRYSEEHHDEIVQISQMAEFAANGRIAAQKALIAAQKRR